MLLLQLLINMLLLSLLLNVAVVALKVTIVFRIFYRTRTNLDLYSAFRSETNPGKSINITKEILFKKFKIFKPDSHSISSSMSKKFGIQKRKIGIDKKRAICMYVCACVCVCVCMCVRVCVRVLEKLPPSPSFSQTTKPIISESNSGVIF